jgi:hypothetical protein
LAQRRLNTRYEIYSIKEEGFSIIIMIASNINARNEWMWEYDTRLKEETSEGGGRKRNKTTVRFPCKEGL